MPRIPARGNQRTECRADRTGGSAGEPPYEGRVDRRPWELLVNTPAQQGSINPTCAHQDPHLGELVPPDASAASLFQNFPSQSGLRTSQTRASCLPGTEVGKHPPPGSLSDLERRLREVVHLDGNTGCHQANMRDRVCTVSRGEAAPR